MVAVAVEVAAPTRMADSTPIPVVTADAAVVVAVVVAADSEDARIRTAVRVPIQAVVVVIAAVPLDARTPMAERALTLEATVAAGSGLSLHYDGAPVLKDWGAFVFGVQFGGCMSGRELDLA